MLPVSAPDPRLDLAWLEGVLREVVETLAPIDRTPCSPGERQAAEWLAARLGSVAGIEVALEDEPSWGTFPPTATGLGAPFNTLAREMVWDIAKGKRTPSFELLRELADA